MADFVVSTLVTARDAASAVYRGTARTLRGEFTRAGVDIDKVWGRVRGGAKSAFDSVTSIGGGFGMAKRAAQGLFTVAKAGLVGGAGLVGMAALAAKAIHGLVDDFTEAGDEIGATATKLGIGVEALQELRYAADMSDVDMSELDSGVLKLNQNLGQAKNKAGKLYKELSKFKDGKVVLGDLLAAEGPEEALAVIIETSKRIPDITKRSAFLKTALGGSGAAWLKFGELGAEGLAKLRVEARAAGIITEDQVEMTGKLDEENKRLGYTWKGLKNTIAAELAPSVLELTSGLREYLTENRALIAEKTVTFIKDAAAAIYDMGVWLKEAYYTTRDWLADGGWQSIKDTLGEVWDVVKGIGSAISTAVEYVGGWQNALLLLGGAQVLGTVFRLTAAIYGAAAASRAAAAAAAAASAASGAGGAGAAGAAGAAAAGGMGIFGGLVTGVGAGLLAGYGAKDAADRQGLQWSRHEEDAEYERLAASGDFWSDLGLGNRTLERVDSRGHAQDTADSISRLTGGAGGPTPFSMKSNIARQYVAQEGIQAGSGTQLYNTLLDKDASLDQLRALNASIQKLNETSLWDMQGRRDAKKEQSEIIVKFDNAPANTKVESKGPAKVKAPVGHRQVGQ